MVDSFTDMRNSEIMDIPSDQIEETLKTKSHLLFENESGKCIVYLKDFDYYYVFLITNTQNACNNYPIKLPKEFVEKHFSSHRNLLDEFLKIVGVPTNISGNTELIVSFNRKEKTLAFNPITFNRIDNRTYGIQNGDIMDFFFCMDIVKYRDFLEEYDIRK